MNFLNNCSPLSFRRYLLVLCLIGSTLSCNFEEIDENNDTEAQGIGSTNGNETQSDIGGSIIATQSSPNSQPNILSNGDLKFSESLFLDKDRKFTTKILSQNEYNTFLTKDGDVTLITKDLYKYYKDDFDFIIILGVETEQPRDLGFFGRNSIVQNNVEGIGGNIFNQGDRFGAKDKLKGVIYMPSTDYIKSGPFLHELAHVWGNKNFIPTTVSGHWGYSSVGGQLGGFDTLTALGNNTYKGTLNGGSFGTFANGGNSIPYSNLELYLMGLIPEEELQSLQVAVNPVSTGNTGEFTADSINTYTASQLIERNGKRIPSAENSQKVFKTLTVVISPTPLSDTKKKAINDLIDPFFKKGASGFNGTLNFWEATGGKASLENTVVDTNLL